MALKTQPNGSSDVPVAGAPLTGGTRSNLSSQTEVTLIQNANGGTDSEAVSVISS